MKLWLIKSKQFLGYDTYDSAVVAAETEEEARYTHPNGYFVWNEYEPDWFGWCHPNKGYFVGFEEWIKPDQVIIEYLGTTDRDIRGVVLASFNAG